MGRAHCIVEGFVAGTRTGTGKSGEFFFNISIACGKSTKDENTGQYENKYQQWWSLTAWGDYARELERLNIAKGAAIMARVDNPRARVYHSEKSQRYEAVIEARLWNFSLASMCWINKKIHVAAVKRRRIRRHAGDGRQLSGQLGRCGTRRRSFYRNTVLARRQYKGDYNARHAYSFGDHEFHKIYSWFG